MFRPCKSPATGLQRAIDLSQSLRSSLIDIARGPRPTYHEGNQESEEGRSLQQQLDNELQTLHSLRNDTIPPISLLPDDVLSEILCTPYYCDWPDASSFADTVVKVCGKWRKIGTNTALLWTSIMIGTREGPWAERPFMKQPVSRTPDLKRLPLRNQTCLQRCRAAPLRIYIGSLVRSADVNHIFSMVAEGVEFGERSVGRIYCDPSCFGGRASPLSQLRARLISEVRRTLRTLHLVDTEHTDSSGRDDGHQSDDQVKQVLASLLQASTSAAQNGPVGSELTLTDLRLHTADSLLASQTQILPFLRFCPKLKFLEVGRYNYALPKEDWQNDVALLPELRLLALVDDRDPEYLLQSIKAPALQELTLSFHEGAIDAGPVRHFLTESKPSLLELTIAYAEYSVDQLMSILELTPSLLNLTFNCTRDTAEVLHDLTPFESRSVPPCPQLKLLRITQYRTWIYEGPLDFVSTSRIGHIELALLNFLARRSVHGAVRKIQILELHQSTGERLGDLWTSSIAKEVDVFLLNGLRVEQELDRDGRHQ